MLVLLQRWWRYDNGASPKGHAARSVHAEEREGRPETDQGFPLRLSPRQAKMSHAYGSSVMLNIHTRDGQSKGGGGLTKGVVGKMMSAGIIVVVVAVVQARCC